MSLISSLIQNESVSVSSVKKLICQICLDEAGGRYYGFHLCSSCKAFFRRNADRGETFKCAFTNSCEINKITRRHCRKCRLSKCFSIGMKRQWVNSPDVEMLPPETSKKFDKVLCNKSQEVFTSERKEPEQLIKPNEEKVNITLILNNLLDTGSIQDLLEKDNDESTEEPRELKKYGDKESFMKNHYLNNSFSCVEKVCTEDSCDFHKLHKEYFTSTGLVKNCDERIILGISNQSCENDSWQWKIHHLIIQAYFTPNELQTDLYSRRLTLSYLESEKIDELDKFSSSIWSIDKYEIPNNIDVPGLLKIFEYCLNCFVPVLNTISTFTSLPVDDRTYLIKRNFIYIILLRLIPVIDLDDESLQIPKTSISLPLKVLQLFHDSIYEAFVDFLRSYPTYWRTSRTSNSLMIAILLFYFTTENLNCPDMIKTQQCNYIYLLRRFVEYRIPDPCKAKSDFYDLMMKLGEFLETVIDIELIRRVAIDHRDYVGPLLGEIFELF